MRSPPKTTQLRRGRGKVSDPCFFTSFHIELFLRCGHASKVMSCLSPLLNTFQWLSRKCKQSLWDVSYNALFTQSGPNLPTYPYLLTEGCGHLSSCHSVCIQYLPTSRSLPFSVLFVWNLSLVTWLVFHSPLREVDAFLRCMSSLPVLFKINLSPPLSSSPSHVFNTNIHIHSYSHSYICTLTCISHIHTQSRWCTYSYHTTHTLTHAITHNHAITQLHTHRLITLCPILLDFSSS